MSAMNFTFEQIERYAPEMASSGLFAVKSKAAALAMMLKGMSLGLNPITSLSAFHIIEGRVEMKADMIVALIRTSGLCKEWTIVETTAAKCTIRAQRVDDAEPTTHTYTIEDAKTAGLAGKGTFLKYPRAMVRARCISELGRMLFPEVTMGVYVEGETTGDDAVMGPSVATLRPEINAPSTVVSNIAPPSASDADALPPPDVSAAPQLEAPVVNALMAEIASINTSVVGWGPQLLALAPRVATDPAAVVAYAKVWGDKFSTFDEATRRQVLGMLDGALPPEAFKHEAWDFLEATRERAAIQGEGADGDGVPS